jgi:hypothetical protein
MHAWAVRLMALAGPGRDGQIDYQVPESDWIARGGTLQDCFAEGVDDSLIVYEVQSETLSGVYRCTIGNMIGELEVAFTYWSDGNLQNAYQFRMLDAETAGPIQARGVFGR